MGQRPTKVVGIACCVGAGIPVGREGPMVHARTPTLALTLALALALTLALGLAPTLTPTPTPTLTPTLTPIPTLTLTLTLTRWTCAGRSAPSPRC